MMPSCFSSTVRIAARSAFCSGARVAALASGSQAAGVEVLYRPAGGSDGQARVTLIAGHALASMSKSSGSGKRDPMTPIGKAAP